MELSLQQALEIVLRQMKGLLVWNHMTILEWHLFTSKHIELLL